MSANRNRRGRRAYLKHISSKHDKQPDSGLKAAIGLGRDINPINALPHRARLWLDKNKHTPTMTEPMSKRTEALHQLWQPKKREWIQNKIDTPTLLVRLLSDTLDERGCFWFDRLDRITGIKQESYTLSSRQHAMELFIAKRIPWK